MKILDKQGTSIGSGDKWTDRDKKLPIAKRVCSYGQLNNPREQRSNVRDAVAKAWYGMGMTIKGHKNTIARRVESNGTLQALRDYPVTIQQQVQRTVLEHMCLRGIERVFGISRRKVARWIAQWGQALAPLATTLAPAPK